MIRWKLLHKEVAALAVTLAVLSVDLPLTAATTPTGNGGYVYVMTNQPTGNAVIQYRRSADGTLTQLGTAATGGAGGTGNSGPVDPLASQDSLVLSGDGTRLLAVNAGSNELSVLEAGPTSLTLLNKVFSGGEFPNSVALYGDLVYVLNAHGTSNVSAFRLSSTGLAAIPNSTFNLPGGSSAAPHDIRFSPDGARLIVSEGGTNQLDIFNLDSDGLITGVETQSSAGLGPFAVRFGRGGVLVSVEATSASVSSYVLTSADTLALISATVPDKQAAACWISLTGNGKFGFVSNAGSGTLSTFQIAGDGTVNLESAVTASLENGHPIDSALSSDGKFAYVLDSASGRLVSFTVHGASLQPISSITGLPATLQGIAAQ